MVRLTEQQDAGACEANAIAALVHLTRSGGGVVERSGSTLMAAGPDPYCGPFHNAAMRLDPDRSPGEVIRRADAFFGRLGRGYVLWSQVGRDDDLERYAIDAGMPLRRPVPGAPDMVVTHPFGEISPPAGVRLAPVAGEADAIAFGQVVAGAYAVRKTPQAATAATPREQADGAVVVNGDPQPRSAALTMFGRPETLLAPKCRGLIAYLDGAPVSCAMLYTAGDVCGLYWVSTVEEARCRGLAGFVTMSAVNDGFRHGARMAVLQASSMGEPLYRNLGFIEVSRHRRFIRS